MMKFALLTYIVILIVLFMTRNLTTTVGIIALLVNMFVLALCFKKHQKSLDGVSEPLADEKEAPKVPQTAPAADEPDPYYPYDKKFLKWDSYNQPMPAATYNPTNVRDISCVGTGTMSVDDAAVSITQARARDRRCSDGWALKDAAYYKYHYAEELNKEEARPWWGNAEL